MIIDTFPDFEAYWSRAKDKDIEEQILLWKDTYMSRHPELLEKQLNAYAKAGCDWKEIARERIFPHIPERLPLMRTARENLLHLCDRTYQDILRILKLDLEITFVIYVGIGCGAGWAARYGGQPACLFGLENIAEEKWHKKESIRGLIAHEVGHLVHMHLRGEEWEEFVKNEENPFFLLYSEGFAQRCEHLTFSRDTWHMAKSDRDWLAWCKANEAFLAGEFLRRIEAGESLTDFFGSWFDICGHSQTGYYLGHEFVHYLERERSLREVAVLSPREVNFLAEEFLRTLAES